MNITTDIILILYGDRTDLNNCIKSIEKYCTEYNLIVIDNNEINRGFTKAANEGIKAGKAPYIWLLNQDALVLEGAQEALIKRFAYHEKVGIVGSQQLDPKNPDRIAFGGAQRAFPSGIHKGGLVSMGHCRFPEKQTWINGASMMIRRKMVEEIGLLDEKLFLLYSDSDYCYMARRAGWEAWYEPASRVYHTLGKASKGVSDWHDKDMKAFMLKWGIDYDPDKKAFSFSEDFSNLDIFP